MFSEDSYQQQCRIDDESAHLDILDTAGQVSECVMCFDLVTYHGLVCN